MANSEPSEKPIEALKRAKTLLAQHPVDAMSCEEVEREIDAYRLSVSSDAQSESESTLSATPYLGGCSVESECGQS